MKKLFFQVQSVKHIAMSFLTEAMRIVLSSPHLRRLALAFLNRHPEFKQRLWLVRAGIARNARSRDSTAPTLTIRVSNGKVELSNHANNIYLELKNIVETSRI